MRQGGHERGIKQHHVFARQWRFATNSEPQHRNRLENAITASNRDAGLTVPGGLHVKAGGSYGWKFRAARGGCHNTAGRKALSLTDSHLDGADQLLTQCGTSLQLAHRQSHYRRGENQQAGRSQATRQPVQWTRQGRSNTSGRQHVTLRGCMSGVVTNLKRARNGKQPERAQAVRLPLTPESGLDINP